MKNRSRPQEVDDRPKNTFQEVLSSRVPPVEPKWTVPKTSSHIQ